jgi:hypothetical protein
MRQLLLRLDRHGGLGRLAMTAIKGESMSGVDTLKAEIKKLSAKAVQAKMDLHDLSEELPVNWRNILEVAQRAHDAFEFLEKKRAELKQLEAA